MGPPSSGWGPGEGDPQRTQVLEYEDKELGGVEPGSRCKGDRKEEPHRQVQGEEGPSGKGPGRKGNGRRCSGGNPPGKLETSERKASSSESEGERSAEGASGWNPTKWFRKRSKEPRGKGKSGLGNPREPERFRSGERLRHPNQGPPKEELEPTPRSAQFEVGESPEGSNNKRTSPGRKPATFFLLASRRHKKHPERHASSRPAAYKSPEQRAKRPAPPKARECPICGRERQGRKGACRHCPRKFKTSSNRRKSEDKSWFSSHPPAGAVRRSHGCSSSSEPENGEDSREGTSLNSSKEDLNNRPTGETNKGAPRYPAPQAPSPSPEREFRRTIRQESFKNLEDANTLEEPDWRENR